jgi:hypothetical protein
MCSFAGNLFKVTSVLLQFKLKALVCVIAWFCVELLGAFGKRFASVQ